MPNRAVAMRLLVPLLLMAPPYAAVAAQPPPAAPTASGMDHLWVEPSDLESRDLFYGPGGRALVPDPDVVYRFRSRDTTGHSGGYKVEEAGGRKWKVKIGDEVGSEIAVSRILWAIGYHQPVMHYLPHWRMTGGPKATPEPGRFRLESDHKKEGDWSWKDNPFVGSQPLRGLLVVNVLLNNWDLHPTNNRIYRIKHPTEGPARRYVVQDLGGSLGKTHWPVGGRNDIDGFESQAFIKSVKDGRVEFDHHGPDRDLLKALTVDDVLWACHLLSRLSERQLTDAFRAADYPDAVQQRYVRKIRQKIGEGLALDAGAGGKK